MAQWSDAQTRLAALMQRLNGPDAVLPAELAAQLQAQAEQCMDANLAGSADLLALLAELVDAETPDAALDEPRRAQLQQVLMQLPLLSPRTSDDEQQEVLATLASDAWQAPLDSDDLDALNEMLTADHELLATHRCKTGAAEVTAMAAEPETEATSVTDAAAEAASVQPIHLAESPEALAEQLQVLAEPLAESDNPLPADLAALGCELIGSCEELSHPAVAAMYDALVALIDQPNRANASAVIERLNDDSWPEPLDDEDIEGQRDLLDEVFPAAEANDVESADEPAPTPAAAGSVAGFDAAPDAKADADADADAAMEATVSTESIAEQLAELAAPLNDGDTPVLADLIALTAELVAACDDADHPLVTRAQDVVQTLLAAPGPDTANALLELMADSQWPEPLDEEDLLDQRDLLSAAFATDAPADVPAAIVSADEASLLDTAGTPEALAELLTSLAEPLSDGDNPVLGDLVTLATEQIGACDSLDQAAIRQIKPLLHELLESPTYDTAQALLHQLGDPAWPEPLEQDDLDDLQALLDETLTEAEAPETDAMPSAVPVAKADAPPETEAEPPAFCEIDMTLLERAGPSVDPGILGMLVGSLQALQEQWQADSGEQPMQLLDTSLDALTPLARACATVDLTGLNLLLTGLSHNLEWFLEHPDSFVPDVRSHFGNCLQAVHLYLDALADKHAREDLIDAISDDRLPIHAGPQQAAFISGLLALASIQSPDDIECETATAEDVALSIGDDIDPQLLEMLYDELPVLVEEFQQQLQAVMVDHEADALLSAQRAAHTIKGLANMAGIKGLANLTHHLEDILEVLTDAKLFPGDKLRRDLTLASDCMAQMSESITEETDAPDNAQQQLQSMMTWFYRLRTEGIECASDPLGKDDTPAPTPAAQAPAAKSAPRPAPAQGGEEKEHAHLRVGVSILDNLFRIAGESSTLNAQLDDALQQLRRLSRSNRERQRVLQKVLFDLEQQLHDHFTLNTHLHESESDFDPLEMDRYNAMHTTLSQLQEAVADVREVDQEADQQLRQLAELHVRQSNLQKESLDNVLHTRLVAVKTISSRMQRIMRQACTAAGKEARLIIEGEDVLMDSQILNQLADPLMHIIRNAVDHGLETPHLRFEAGKDETGTLTIRFDQRNGKVHVSCEDDGAGINLQRVRKIAEDKGIVAPDAELSDRDIQRLILVPGFSTRDEISQLSGRGIGMDVVHQQLTRMQGSLNIHSEFGVGSRFELTMPASSLLVQTLLVRSSGRREYALSSHTIEQSLLSMDGEFRTTDHGMKFVTADGEYPAYTLESLVGEPPADYQNLRIHPVLVVKLGQGEKAAVLVREVIAHRELVFKSLGEHVPDIAGIAGVTILANGDVAPIVDLPARILDRNSVLAAAHDSFEPAFELRLPHLLVVDDSLSARKTLATLLSDSGYQVTTAIDGLDALDKVRSDPPELILTDLEMPRMTGMELAAIIRNSEKYSRIPVVMITSRSTSKHRGEAEAAGVSAYLTKPWTEAGVLEKVQSLLF